MTRVTTRDGFEVYAEAHGEGPPLILSPGYCQTHENFRPQVEPFVAAGYRVVLWDYRGHGKSAVPEALSAYTIQHVVDDLGSVLEWAAPGQPAVVGGLSFGVGTVEVDGDAVGTIEAGREGERLAEAAILTRARDEDTFALHAGGEVGRELKFR